MAERGRKPGFVMSEEQIVRDCGYCVYVVGGPKGKKPVKIGYAKDMTKRLAALQVGSPVELTVWGDISKLRRHEAQNIEREAHKLLSDRHVRGEWFDISAEEATDAIGRLVNTRVYSARIVLSFDISDYIEPERIVALRGVSLLSMENNAVC